MKQLILNTEVKRPLSKIWEFGVNTCHAPLWLRTDLAGQLTGTPDGLKAANIVSPDSRLVTRSGKFSGHSSSSAPSPPRAE